MNLCNDEQAIDVFKYDETLKAQKDPPHSPLPKFYIWKKAKKTLKILYPEGRERSYNWNRRFDKYPKEITNNNEP
jgi:hypothetical protein